MARWGHRPTSAALGVEMSENSAQFWIAAVLLGLIFSYVVAVHAARWLKKARRKSKRAKAAKERQAKITQHFDVLRQEHWESEAMADTRRMLMRDPKLARSMRRAEKSGCRQTRRRG